MFILENLFIQQSKGVLCDIQCDRFNMKNVIKIEFFKKRGNWCLIDIKHLCFEENYFLADFFNFPLTCILGFEILYFGRNVLQIRHFCIS